ncbi:hypothetical protein AQJ91_07875 [Streptomyces dysideae]|uniref:Uncharacterized protein n=1 Tax=Streptomyces dysideae TaxID=909626 RepID=A0A101V367_9ACTN|nr:hypothetical protein AQJ91_07875 [Streptomyces dysideae]
MPVSFGVASDAGEASTESAADCRSSCPPQADVTARTLTTAALIRGLAGEDLHAELLTKGGLSGACRERSTDVGAATKWVGVTA